MNARTAALVCAQRDLIPAFFWNIAFCKKRSEMAYIDVFGL